MSGKLTLISSATASGSASLSFTSGIDSTYNEYVFYFVDIDASTQSSYFAFQVNPDGGSGYNQQITSTTFYAQHDGTNALGPTYVTDADQANGTGYQYIGKNMSTAAKASLVGELHLYVPASTTRVKHFIARTHNYEFSNPDPYAAEFYIAGYINTTSAIDEIDFKCTSGNFNGNIYMFGVK